MLQTLRSRIFDLLGIGPMSIADYVFLAILAGVAAVCAVGGWLAA